jgi:hypothetical protein
MSVIATRVKAVLDDLDQHVDGIVDRVKLKAHRDPWATCFNIGALLGVIVGAVLF